MIYKNAQLYSVEFLSVPEPESCVHTASDDVRLLDGLYEKSCFLWNGLRGGLIVPAVSMFVNGLDASAFLMQWEQRGADREKIIKGSYYSYRIADLYEFSEGYSEESVNKLKEKFMFLISDAPSLKERINEKEEVHVKNLHEEYERISRNNTAQGRPVLFAGKGLTRTPAIDITFPDSSGNLFLAQLIISGRLHNHNYELYKLKTDSAVRQIVVNIINGII